MSATFAFLKGNTKAWTYDEMPGLSTDLVCHVILYIYIRLVGSRPTLLHFPSRSLD